MGRILLNTVLWVAVVVLITVVLSLALAQFLNHLSTQQAALLVEETASNLIIGKFINSEANKFLFIPLS